MTVNREIVGSPFLQGEDEQIVYSLTTTPWGTSPTTPAVVVKDMSDAAKNVTATVTTGTATANGDVITLPLIKSLTAGHEYRVAVRFTANGNVFEPFFILRAAL
jgi:hypothetical protein